MSGGAHSYLFDLTEEDLANHTITKHPPSGYAVTFHVSRLVVHLFGHLLTSQVLLNYPVGLERFVIQIWATRPLVEWPPSRTMDVPALMPLRRPFPQ